MKTNLPRPAAAFLLTLSLTLPAFSQTGQQTVILGEIQHTSEVPVYDFTVVLQQTNGHSEVAKSDVASDGTFRFHDVPYGDYLLRIENYYGDSIQEEFVTVDSQATDITIRLAKRIDPRPPSGGVSASRLRHPPAKKALQAFLAARKFSQGGRYAEAAAELERAIQISPDYAEAYSNLGAMYAHLGRYEDAIAQISRAMQIGTPNSLDLSNLAWAQMALRRYDNALQSVEAGLKMEPANPNAHFILGMLLARNHRTLREAASHLEIAAQSNPSARSTLQQVRAALAAEPPVSQ